MKKLLFLFGSIVVTACSSHPTKQAATLLDASRFPASNGNILVCQGTYTHKKMGRQTEKLEIQGDGSALTVIMTSNSVAKVINNIRCDKTPENVVKCDSFSANEDKSDPGTGYNFQIKSQDNEYLITGTRSVQFNQRTYQQIYWVGQCTPPLDQLGR